MRKIRDVLRMRHANGLSQRAIAQSLGVSKGSIDNYLRRAQVAGLVWPLPDDLSDQALYDKLFPPARVPEAGRRPEPDWAAIYQELRKPGVTLRLLWEEYRANHPDGYGQSRFYALYRAWAGRLAPRMRQTHLAGDRMFVDFAGQTVPVVNPLTGEIHQAQIFVAVLGASSYTYAQATWTQQLPDWCAAHVRAFAFFGGVANLLVSDNLKAGIAKACFYEARPNSTYAELANHYGTVIQPARPRRPRDKSKVEVGVQVVERWVLARLRKRTFTSLAALNAAIAELVTDLNARTTRHLGTSRRALFDSLEAPALKPLPAVPYEYAEWREAGVGLDYHVEVDRHFYSVPSSLLRERVTVRVTAASVEIFHKGKRVAAHARSPASRRHTTVAEHMPSSHRRYAEWTPERLQRQADKIGPNAGALVAVILRDKPHPEQGFRACLGILRLARSYGETRLEAACARAIEIGARSYSSVSSILKNNLDRHAPEPAAEGPTIVHPNIRGAGYYH